MSTRYPIPHEALDDRLAWTGTSGTGKTYDAGTAIERVLREKSRACIVDPLGVWWGLRLRADGAASSPFNVAIFGGPHGDIAITETSGKLIGEAVAGTAESCIVDLSEFDTEAAQRRFMLAFLVSLYGGLKGDLLHLVLDEADMWAPQRIMDKEGDATRLHHNVQKIVRRGRVKGFIPWLITQRPAELSKSVLSQVDGIVAHQLVAPQDVKALMEWVSGRADEETAGTIKEGLPGFERGQAVVYIPRRRVLAIAQFPKKATFDSSRSPERGEKKNRPDIALKPLDLATLKKRLEKVEADAKANDPNALKTQIADLQRQLRGRPAETKTVTVKDEAAIAKAEERGFDRAKKEVAAAADQRIKEKSIEQLEALASLINPLAAFIDDQLKAAKRDKLKISAQVAFTPSPAISDRASATGFRPAIQRTAPARRPISTVNGADSDRPLKAERKPLAALASVYPAGMTEAQWAVAAGLKRSGGTWGTYVSRLRMAGRIAQQGDVFFTTEQGIADLGGDVPTMPPPGPELVDFWARKIKAASKLLRYLADQYPNFITRDELGAALNLATGGGTFGTYLSRLRTPGLIEEQGEQLRAAPQLMEAA